MKKSLLLSTLIIAVLLAVGLVVAIDPMQTTAQEGVEVIPFLDEWAGSPHADASAEAFIHWDEDDPAEIPDRCAKCHSTAGYLDFLGADGTEFGSVESAHDIGSVVTCEACHNDVTLTMDSVVMPSGIEITDVGREARCMQCHQGRQSKATVDETIAELGVDDDTTHEELGFLNIHYYPAAATKYGTLAKGGYEYDGKAYDAMFAHVEGVEACGDCHDTHTLEVKVDGCVECHTDVTEVEDFKDVRMAGSLVDYDGDGNIVEGVHYEIEGLREMLLEAIQAYADKVSETPIMYGDGYPYFLNADTEEGYKAWTPRLLKAAYNYQLATKDPGAYAHGGKYIIQLLYDSIEDMNSQLDAPIDLTDAHRNDHGHFAGSEEAFRHWDEDDPAMVPASCSKCHADTGLPLFHMDDTAITQAPSNGFQCATCHISINEEEEAPQHVFEQVEFPSGLVVDSDNADPNTLLCMNCHQGRQSTTSVNKAIDGLAPDVVSEDVGFQNVHYFAAGATRYGTQAKGAYEYDGNEYSGFLAHSDEAPLGCTDCHDSHELEVQVDSCTDCHEGISAPEDFKGVRMSEVDFDGDGDVTEGAAGEIETMHEALYAAIQDYAVEKVETGIVYGNSYPYFFVDTDNDRMGGSEEILFPNRYATWTPRLLQAAYNYQYAAKDPGAYTHNPDYVIQTLYDSIENIGGNVDGMTRPEVRY